MTPFELIALKQKVGAEYADEVALFVLCHFDAAKRGRCTGQGYNFISRHLIQAYYIMAKLKDQARMRVLQLAGDAWRKAGDRPTDAADLTTSEYMAVRAGLALYLKTLPKIEVGTYRQASNAAEKLTK